LLGMTFPIATKLYVKSDSLLGTEVNAVYAFNTVGGIAGSLAAGFILLPVIGCQNTLLAAALLSAAAGMALFMGAGNRLLPIVCGLSVISAILFVPTWNPELMTAGVYKYAPYYASNSDLETMLTSGDLLYFKDGTAATVSVR